MMPATFLLLLSATPPAEETSVPVVVKVSAAGPLKSLAAAADEVRRIADRGWPEGGVLVLVADGVYPVDEVADFDVEATERSPLVIRAARPFGATLDGTLYINPIGFRPAGNDPRLAAEARKTILKCKLAEDAAEALRRRPRANLLQAGRLLTAARYPDLGYAHIRDVIAAPTTPAAASGSRKNPAGPAFTLRETTPEPDGRPSRDAEQPGGTAQQWAAQTARHGQTRTEGYVTGLDKRSVHDVAAVDPFTGAVLLATPPDGWLSRHAVEPDRPSRLVVRGLLCELTSPGEWFFDADAGELFLRPVTPQNPQAYIGIAAADGAVRLSGRFTSLEGFVIEGIESGTAVRLDGSDNRVAGCVVRSGAATAFAVAGLRNRVRSCDAYDVGSFADVSGGESSADGIEEAGNAVDNCHFTMRYWPHRQADVTLAGAGNRVSNCLIHNLPRRAVAIRGNRNSVERCEIFNVGFEEGRGGAIEGLGEMWGYGTAVRNNFVHHLMNTPGLPPRAGVALLNRDGGREVTGNAFFKAGHAGVLIDGGSGNAAVGNLFVEGCLTVHTEAGPASDHADRGEYGPVWRTEQVVGKRGWNNPFWRTAYPRFARVMNHAGPAGNVIRGNVAFSVYESSVCLSKREPAAADDGVRRLTDGQFTRGFAGPDRLDFRPRDRRGQTPDWMPPLAFESIGLLPDRFRPEVPDATAYRRAVRERFRGRRSSNPQADYAFEETNAEIFRDPPAVDVRPNDLVVGK